MICGFDSRADHNRLHPFGKGQTTNTMKATHNKHNACKWNYPFLGVASDGMIVLFTDEKKGTALFDPLGENLSGEFLTNWDMSHFTPLPSTESVTLQND
jgi:hypothetical protein